MFVRVSKALVSALLILQRAGADKVRVEWGADPLTPVLWAGPLCTLAPIEEV
jgi:hypothetical protein